MLIGRRIGCSQLSLGKIFINCPGPIYAAAIFGAFMDIRHKFMAISLFDEIVTFSIFKRIQYCFNELLI